MRQLIISDRSMADVFQADNLIGKDNKYGLV
jgi:hypothetical protein